METSTTLKAAVAIILCFTLNIGLQTLNCFAQNIGINSTGATPDNSAMLDVVSTTKGMLIPRMTGAEKYAITTPATGLLIFQSDTVGFWYYNGTKWIPLLSSTSSTGGSTGGWSLTGNSGTTASNFLGTTDNVSLRLRTNDTTRMIVDSLGRIGMGVTTNSARLRIFQPDASLWNTLSLEKSSGSQGAGIFSLSYFGSTSGGIVETSAGPIRFYTTASATRSEKVRIDTSGNVGIGTTSPGARLQVSYGTSHELLSLNQTTPASFNVDLTWQSNGTSRWITSVRTAANSDFWFYNVGRSFSDITILNSNGNVGIHCTSPQYPLHVVGDVGVVGTIFATAASVSSGVVACSDIRYKKDITPLPNALSNVMKLQGVNYFWKTKEFPDKNFNNEKQIGFIAQEIEKIYPEVVLTDKEGYKSVDYSRLTPVLVEAIKELKAEKDNAELRIKNAEFEIAELKAAVNLFLKQSAATEVKK